MDSYFDQGDHLDLQDRVVVGQAFFHRLDQGPSYLVDPLDHQVP